MFISDLSYLETTVSSDVLGGSRGGKGKRVDIDITSIKQVATAKSSAYAYKGNAKSTAIAVNVAYA
ncbi:hypothetical protein [Leptothoe sp. PORK10 BA2]|uniref:hypothetical protein n=1 Tax=Leptothoe sp. PORK10 BA2 TaxID=3110254 RepID=UPI002B1F4AF0|nr:hypothetical protein [Leptothoe sp. PORK10 BA2]MEA5466581.1 hypothetical protein [Leptothoe sp. PORK10 BA2]